MVSIMPGMEMAAPERTDTKSGSIVVAKLLPADRFELPEPGADLILQTVGPAAIVCAGTRTGLGGDGKAGRDRETDASHLRQPRALPPSRGFCVPLPSALPLPQP